MITSRNDTPRCSPASGPRSNPDGRTRRCALALALFAAAAMAASCSSGSDGAPTTAAAPDTLAGTSAAAPDTAAPDTAAPQTAAPETAAADTAAAGESSTVGAAPAGSGGTFRYGMPEPTALDPGLIGDAYGAQLSVQYAKGLTSIGPDLKAVPAIAASWKVNSDGSVYTFALRPDAKFSNGRTVVAEDFVYTFARNADPDLASPVAYQGLAIKGWGDVMGAKPSGAVADAPVSGVKAIDPQTLEVTLDQPFALLPKVLSHNVFAALPKEALDTPEKVKAFAAQPVASGPYVVAEPWAHNERIVLTRNPSYTGTPGKADRIEVRIYASLETSFRDLEAGNLDASEVPGDLVPQARSEFGDRLLVTPTAGLNYLGFPTTTAPFDKSEVRRALSLAVDREAGARTSNGTAMAADAFIPAGSPYVGANGCANAALDAAKAKAMLAAAGGIPGNRITLNYPTGGPNDAAIKAIANDWKANLGLDVTLNGLEFAPFIEALRAGKLVGPVTLGWLWDYPSGYNFLSPLYESTSSDNAGKYHSEAFDSLMGRIRTAPTEEAGGPLIDQAAAVLCGDMPGTPLSTSVSNLAFGPTVKGLKVTPSGFVNFDVVTVTG